jgi:hypothetical protein
MSKDKPEDRSARAWNTWKDTLTEQAGRAVSDASDAADPVVAASRPKRLDDTETESYRDFFDSLTSAGQEALAVEPENDTEAVEPAAVRYCLVEAPDGEWPVQRVFKTAEGLARRLGQLEGQDVVATPYYGIPLRLTKGPQRYLLLPDGQSAIQVPMYPDGPAKVVEADLLGELEIQEDNHLGKPELTESRTLADKLRGKKYDEDEDEEDEDGDEEEYDEV